ncbi:MAG: T9SS type A sorting domain-containing protein [Flavobacteriales bacterium]|nr:MAG: T9SS type A sorting domain-containing protein [Flavobacteriales bacterium]
MPRPSTLALFLTPIMWWAAWPAMAGVHEAAEVHRPYAGRCGSTVGDEAPGGVSEDAAITSIQNIPALACGVDSVAPVITLKNNGQQVLTSATIEYSVNAGTVLTQPWAGSLQSGQTTTVELARIAADPGSNTLVVRVTAPNGLSDEVPENDAWTHEFYTSAPGGLVSLILTLDDFGSDVRWKLLSSDSTMLYSGGPYSDGHNGDTDSVAFCLTNDCYTFIITDAFGNGICCADGEGGLVIRDTMGVVHAESDGQYGDQYAAEFCLTAVHVPERTHAPFGVFPNPNQGAFTVRGGPAYAIRRIAVIDALGRTVAKVQGQGGAAQFLALDLPNGSYLLLVDGATGAAPARMVVAR